jgi:DNA-binding transcriptional LysR family regulator
MRSDWLEAFLIFSASMNFTRAARALHISQPALHVKVGKLANSLGQPLYGKVGRELRLTPAGVRVAAYARDQRDRSRALIAELRTGKGQWPVSICAGTGAYLYLLGPAISRFSRDAAHPLTLMTGDKERTIGLVSSGEAHLGVTTLDAAPEGLIATLLTRVDQVLVMPSGHRLARRRTIRLADLEGVPLVVPPQPRPHRAMLDRMLMDAGVSWRVAVEAGGWELMLHFVALGIGLAIVNSCCRLPSGLSARPLVELPGLSYQILQRPESEDHQGAAALKTLLLENREAWRGAR